MWTKPLLYSRFHLLSMDELARWMKPIHPVSESTLKLLLGKTMRQAFFSLESPFLIGVLGNRFLILSGQQVLFPVRILAFRLMLSIFQK